MKQLGDILVEAEIISKKTLERALARQKESKQRLGAVLEEMGVITEEELADALGAQFNFKTIKNFIERTFSQELLDLLPSDFAMKKLVFPLKQMDQMLAVAITDPFDVETMEMLVRMTGLQIISGHIDPPGNPGRHLQKLPQEPCPYGGWGRDIDCGGVGSHGYHSPGCPVQSRLPGAYGRRRAGGADRGNLGASPVLIITDAILPRMDGFALLRALKANPMTSAIPVIMLTSKASSEDEQKALEYGFIDFIPKPIQPLRIVSRVKRALELTRKYKPLTPTDYVIHINGICLTGRTRSMRG